MVESTLSVIAYIVDHVIVQSLNCVLTLRNMVKIVLHTFCYGKGHHQRKLFQQLINVIMTSEEMASSSIKTLLSFGESHNSNISYQTKRLSTKLLLTEDFLPSIFYCTLVIKMLEGPARKVLLLLLCSDSSCIIQLTDILQIGLALALLTILPWLLIVIGFGLITAVSKVCMHANNWIRLFHDLCAKILWFSLIIISLEGSPQLFQGFGLPPVGPALFPYWFISVLGIPIVVLGAVHAVISARSAGRILRTIVSSQYC